MTWRDVILAFAVGLAAGLLPGCVHTRPDPNPYPEDGDMWPPREAKEDSHYNVISYVEQSTEITPPRQPDVVTPVHWESSAREEQPATIGPSKPPTIGEPIIVNATVLGSGPAEEPVIAAMRYLLENRPAEALQQLGRYEQPNQDILIELLPWLARLTKGSLEAANPKELTNLEEQIDLLDQALRPRAALTIDKLCFCRRVKGFGEYEPLPAGHAFRAGFDGVAGERMQIYVEVRNFSSRAVGPLHETRLASKVEIRDANGAVEYRKDIPAEPDRSLSPRHDYYFICYLPLPPDLPPGRHSLVVEVRDVTGHATKRVPPHRIARQELSFDVAAGDAARAPRPDGSKATSAGAGGG
jgi:hypothetical protein